MKKRKEVLSIATLVIAVTLLGLVLVGSMPLWLPVVTVRPGMLDKLSERAQKALIRQGIKSMMAGGMS